ncbi:MAG TPA: hypothetical protein VIY73_20975 [Polyangiaceae bacterium]
MKITAPHWVIAVLVLLGTLAPQLAAQFPAVGWLVTVCGVITQLDPIVLGVLGVTTASAVTGANVSAAVKAGAVKVAGAGLMLGAAFALSGCLSSAPLVPVTSANQAQVSACQNTAALHDGIVVGGFVLSGATAGLAGGAAAVPDANTKTTLGVVGAVLGGMAVVDAAIAELTASNFSNSSCSQVVGPLPTAKNPGQ